MKKLKYLARKVVPTPEALYVYSNSILNFISSCLFYKQNLILCIFVYIFTNKILVFKYTELRNMYGCHLLLAL